MKKTKNISSEKSKHIGLNSSAAINNLVIDALPISVYAGGQDIIPFGIDNYYPWRINQAIKKSPTAAGCLKRHSEFVYGQGFGDAGEVVVNRNGETLNQIALKFIRKGYSSLNGGALHFNFDLSGRIVEIFHVDLEYVRKERSLMVANYGLYDPNLKHGFFQDEYIEVDLYGGYDPVERMREIGVNDYRGQIYYFSADGEIYPSSTFESVAVSAEYERESQLFPYANIKNGFSGAFIVKQPVAVMGTEEGEKAITKTERNIKKLTGPGNAGGGLVIEVPLDMDDKMSASKIIETITPTNIDGMFKIQDETARNRILTACMMPGVLLGISEDGMFNMASFEDAFDYKNGDTEFDRKIIEAEFIKIIDNSIFSSSKLELKPLDMKRTKQEFEAEGDITKVDEEETKDTDE